MGACLLGGAGCALDPFACGTQSRVLDATGTLAGVAPADTGTVMIAFLQLRGGDRQHSLTWFIRGSVDTARVTAVHLHRGRAGEEGPVLCSFPNGYAGPRDVITQSGPQLWSGTTDYETLFRDIRDGAAYVDVHTLDRPEGALRGQLTVDRERGWQDACT